MGKIIIALIAALLWILGWESYSIEKLGALARQACEDIIEARVGHQIDTKDRSHWRTTELDEDRLQVRASYEEKSEYKTHWCIINHKRSKLQVEFATSSQEEIAAKTRAMKLNINP